jgi:hypothetical protein
MTGPVELGGNRSAQLERWHWRRYQQRGTDDGGEADNATCGFHHTASLQDAVADFGKGGVAEAIGNHSEGA